MIPSRQHLGKIIVPLALALALSVPPTFEILKKNAIDGLLFDLSVSVRSLFAKNLKPYEVVVIGIDDDSLEDSRLEIAGYKLRELPQSFMQPVWAKLIEGLIGEESKVLARRIGFDIFFVWTPGRFTKSDEFEGRFRKLVTQHRNTRKVILARGKRELTPPYNLPPWEPIVGIASPVPDADGVIRRGWREPPVEEGTAPKLGFASLVSGQCENPKGARCLKIPDEFLLVPRESSKKIPGFRLMDVLGCLDVPGGKDTLQKLFKDKVVLVGTTSAGQDIKRTADRFMSQEPYVAPSLGTCKFQTPVNPHENGLPGVYLIASTVDAILNNSMPVQVSSWLITVVTFALTALMALFALLWRPAILAGICVIGTAALFVNGAVLLGFNLWVPTAWPTIALVLSALGAYTFRYVTEEREKIFIREGFEHYVSPSVIDQLTAEPQRLALGGDSKPISILFSDIRGFTSISEQYRDRPKDLISLMHDYFNPLSETILERGGTIDKYIGDSIMAFWNAPLDVHNHELLACKTALAMQRKVTKLNYERKERSVGTLLDDGPPADILLGIGINTGTCVVGNLGSIKRFDYSAIGDPVNVASRLEAQTKIYGVGIIIGPDTARAVGEDLLVLPLDRVAVQGKSEAIDIYTVLDRQDLDETHDMLSHVSAHQMLLEHYRQRHWDYAEHQAKGCLGNLDKRLDGYYKMLSSRIEEFRIDPPSQSWDGVYSAETK